MKELDKNITPIIGIDEVGRGPLAGPVTLGFFVIKINNIRFIPDGITDSKLLTPKKREAYTGEMREGIKKGLYDVFVTHVSAQEIDNKGINIAINTCLEKGFSQIDFNKDSCHVLLDGGLRAPSEFTSQETIVKGDQKESVIGAASVFAKVVRDKYMKDLDKEYPIYEFGKHKGYGTKIHREAIRLYGFCDEHRKTYCKNIVIEK